jgi:hypothetical protein
VYVDHVANPVKREAWEILAALSEKPDRIQIMIANGVFPHIVALGGRDTWNDKHQRLRQRFLQNVCATQVLDELVYFATTGILELSINEEIYIFRNGRNSFERLLKVLEIANTGDEKQKQVIVAVFESSGFSTLLDEVRGRADVEVNADTELAVNVDRLTALMASTTL